MNPMLELAADFILDGKERIVHVEEILLGLPHATVEERRELLVSAKRDLHTLKGNSGMMGFSGLQDLAHSMEDRVEEIDPGSPEIAALLADVDRMRTLMDGLDEPGQSPRTRPAAPRPTVGGDGLSDSIRVSFADLDALVDVLAEMVIFRNRLAEAVQEGRHAQDSDHAWDEMKKAEEALGSTLNVIQDQVMGLRMVPLKSLFVRLKRVVHDVAAADGKAIAFAAEGGETPLDKALLEVASEALGHIIRNAAVHGVETPGERRAAGKPRQATIRISATAEANEVLIDVEDDGRGIDPRALVASARARGIEFDGADDPYSLLFHAGFSTRGEADKDAGRGMGLTAAVESVRRLGGRISVNSRPGQGSRFRLHLPLSVSITRALMLRADDELYALPISHVEESLHFAAGKASEVNHALVYRRRDEVIPLVDLGLSFATTPSPRTHGFVVVIGAAGKRRGLLVDAIAGIREIVVKGLDPLVGAPAGVSGSTILGDGRVVLILDPNELVEMSPSLRQGVSQ